MRRGERGQAAGIETIPFGILVFVGGLLLVVNAWAVVDHRGAVDAAASAYLRAYTAAPSLDAGRVAGEDAARRSLGDRRSLADHLVISHPAESFGPCRVATVTVSMDVPMVRMPFLGEFGETTVSVSAVDLIQPFARTVGSAADRNLRGTVCDG